MRSNILLFLTTILLLYPVTSIASDTEKDKLIIQKVSNLLLKEHDIPNTKIQVISKNGVVKLIGVVDTSLQANRIIELASSVKSVIDINTDKLKVKNSKEFLSDAFITAKAKGKIKYLAINNKISPEYELHIETTNKVVHILGDVKNNNDIKTIKKSINDIIDVEDVKVNIMCK
jgi:osmotically-inducible protein OsmY